jgi:hypothetical protein
MSQQTSGGARTNERPPHAATTEKSRAPHPATAIQAKTPHAAISVPRVPHPATVVQPRALHPAVSMQSGLPHPATVVQAKAPHPATVVQTRSASQGLPLRPPHAATLGRSFTAQPMKRERPVAKSKSNWLTTNNLHSKEGVLTFIEAKPTRKEVAIGEWNREHPDDKIETDEPEEVEEKEEVKEPEPKKRKIAKEEAKSKKAETRKKKLEVVIEEGDWQHILLHTKEDEEETRPRRSWSTCWLESGPWADPREMVSLLVTFAWR